LLRRLFRNKDGLLRVLERPEIPINTNAAENDIRLGIPGPKIPPLASLIRPAPA
jgi:hypothetical protein